MTALVDRIDPLAKDRSIEHERRVSLRADIERIRDRLSEELDGLFRTGGYDLLIIGGHDYEVPAFLEFLARDLLLSCSATSRASWRSMATLPAVRKSDAAHPRRHR